MNIMDMTEQGGHEENAKKPGNVIGIAIQN